MAGLNFRNELLKKLANRFEPPTPSVGGDRTTGDVTDSQGTGSISGYGRGCESLDTSLNESFDYLDKFGSDRMSDNYSENSPISDRHRKRITIQRSSSTQAIVTPRDHVIGRYDLGQSRERMTDSPMKGGQTRSNRIEARGR